MRPGRARRGREVSERLEHPVLAGWGCAEGVYSEALCE